MSELTVKERIKTYCMFLVDDDKPRVGFSFDTLKRLKALHALYPSLVSTLDEVKSYPVEDCGLFVSEWVFDEATLHHYWTRIFIKSGRCDEMILSMKSPQDRKRDINVCVWPDSSGDEVTYLFHPSVRLKAGEIIQAGDWHGHNEMKILVSMALVDEVFDPAIHPRILRPNVAIVNPA